MGKLFWLWQNEYIYNGLPRTPAVTFTVNSVTLRQGVDYTVSYRNKSVKILK